MGTRDDTSYNDQTHQWDPEQEVHESVTALRETLADHPPSDDEALQERQEDIRANVEKLTEAVFDSSEVLDSNDIQTVMELRQTLLDRATRDGRDTTDIHRAFAEIDTNLTELYTARADHEASTAYIIERLLEADQAATYRYDPATIGDLPCDKGNDAILAAFRQSTQGEQYLAQHAASFTDYMLADNLQALNERGNQQIPFVRNELHYQAHPEQYVSDDRNEEQNLNDGLLIHVDWSEAPMTKFATQYGAGWEEAITQMLHVTETAHKAAENLIERGLTEDNTNMIAIGRRISHQAKEMYESALSDEGACDRTLAQFGNLSMECHNPEQKSVQDIALERAGYLQAYVYAFIHETDDYNAANMAIGYIAEQVAQVDRNTATEFSYAARGLVWHQEEFPLEQGFQRAIDGAAGGYSQTLANGLKEHNWDEINEGITQMQDMQLCAAAVSYIMHDMMTHDEWPPEPTDQQLEDAISEYQGQFPEPLRDALDRWMSENLLDLSDYEVITQPGYIEYCVQLAKQQESWPAFVQEVTNTANENMRG